MTGTSAGRMTHADGSPAVGNQGAGHPVVGSRTDVNQVDGQRMGINSTDGNGDRRCRAI